MRALWQDLLVSLRTLRREPASALIASITLALGIGLCTTAFSLSYGVFKRGLGVPEADRLTLVLQSDPARNRDFMPVPVHDFHDWREQQTSFEGLAGYYNGTVNLSGTEGPERFDGGFVTANTFDLLRVRPVLGSSFREGDDRPGAPLTVVLSHQLWVNRYASDPGVVGRSVIVNGEPATVLGVMPPGFRFPENELLWVALRDARATLPGRRSGQPLDVFGRLRDGVTLEQAGAEMSAIAGRIAAAWPATNEGITTRFRTFVEGDTGPELRAVFGAMQVATLFVLLIAIANVANLLLARATLRTREAAVRNALGASRLRIVLPFFAETLVLAGAGALMGTAIAYAGVTLFDGATSDVGKPYYMRFALDLPVLLFVAGVAVATALLAGAAPAVQVLRSDINGHLKDEGRGSSGVLGGRLTRGLVVAEVALSCALLIGGGLMAKSLIRLRNFNFPFATESVFTARVGLFETEYPDSAARRLFFQGLEERLAALPGVQAAALTSNLPLSGNQVQIGVEGATYARDEDHPLVRTVAVTPGYFATFEAGLLSGRPFTAGDGPNSLPVAIVTAAFAEEYFPGRDPVGLRFAERRGPQGLGPWRTIVGVAPNLNIGGFGPERSPDWGYYVPLAQMDLRFVSLAVRTAGDPLALTPQVREVMRALNPNLPIYNVYSMATVIRRALWFYPVFGTLFIVFGAAALFMATVGLYGVLSFSVSRRLREMGIRMALGASPRAVIRLIMRQGAGQLVAGLAVGLLLAFGLTRVLGFLMFETTPQDPPVFTLVVLVISGAGMLASLVPARRATMAEPTEALRAD